MRAVPIAFTTIACLVAAGCGPTQSPATFDTGSMALPAPQAAGEFQRPAPTGIDTGSMTPPTIRRPGQTVPVTRDSKPDTGSMAYPGSRADGVIRPNTAP